MDQSYLKKWMEETNKRLDALEGRKNAPPPPPAPKKPVSNYPRWIYRRNPTSGEVEAMLVKTEAEMPPEGSYSDSPANLEAAEERKAVVEPDADPDLEIPHPSAPKAEESSVPDMTEEMTVVEIPDNWRELHHSTRIKLAKLLPGGDDVVSNDDAIALIELELENRGNAD